MEVMWYLWTCCCIFFPKVLLEDFLLFTAVPTMSKDWDKFAWILEKEEQEFRRALQEKVSIFLILLSLVVNKRIMTGAGIITQHQIEL